jgi:DNA gyrase/topoisomerase IV subunit A
MSNFKHIKAELPPAEQLIEELLKEMSFEFLMLKYDCSYIHILKRMMENRAALKNAKELIRKKKQETIASEGLQQRLEGKQKNNRARFGNLLQQYIDMEGNLKALAAKYKLSKERIRQILAEKNTEFQKAKEFLKQKKREQIIQRFIELVKSKGYIPNLMETRQIDVKIASQYYKCREAAAKQGFTFKRKTNDKEREKKKSDMLQHLKDLAIVLNHTPCSRDIAEAGKYSGPLYLNYFGSLSNAQKLAGLVPNRRGNPNNTPRKTTKSSLPKTKLQS